MGILDTFKGKQYKNELETLQKEYSDLKASITPEMQEAFTLQNQVSKLHLEVFSLTQTIKSMNSEIAVLNKEIAEKEKNIIRMDEEILVQEFGLYEPKFNFASALDYKEELASIRAKQKELIKSNAAVSGNTNWQVNGNAVKGRKMVTDTQKLLLRAFNSECDELVSKVKYTNFDASLDKIYKLADNISKLGSVMDIKISPAYLSAKTKELRLAFEYQLKKQEEKEAQKAAREEQREQARIQRELDEQKKRFEKEQTHYQTAYERLKLQIEKNPTDSDLLDKKEKLENQLSDIDKALEGIDYRQANMRAGYVYIISNIGSFGKDIYKIGMTRRLDPQERIDELGSASVPFNFDVHAMIFSDDAPALEAALHRAFE
ncbi:MAG: DUF4041 domain-containing protein, partial [bacterium]|nr:DUF4041 domain-containing protein [bacterium]